MGTMDPKRVSAGGDTPAHNVADLEAIQLRDIAIEDRDARIEELEAKVSVMKGQRNKALSYNRRTEFWKARAEKAETEVERLRAEVCPRHYLGIHSRRCVRVNPSGDTLGKERDDG